MIFNEMKIGFIGAGNMSSAIIKGIIQSGRIQSSNISVSDIDSEKLKNLQSNGVNICRNNINVVKNSDVIILAVKPQVYPAILNEIADIENIEDKTIVSIAAGISIKYVKSFFCKDVKVVRTMPNTPALVGEGMTIMSYELPVTKSEFDLIQEIFKNVGEVECVDEHYMNEIIAVSSSSPAYVYIMIEAMADAAVIRGIPRNLAYRLVAQTILGSAKMVLETGIHPGELKDMVCSPGGTTIQAVYQLEKDGFRASLISAMEKCTEKALELSKKYN